eukprot:TRINITY_DN2767_c0_g1_i3.p1 TRINITY_DN2767_c0_g1~~TRINITY_DN2767_c0_g1_i3.p1  ORF type:complete len:555 (+),score=189.10 TRINITY_DN2767_c0_g1_i3:109-1773(+)
MCIRDRYQRRVRGRPPIMLLMALYAVCAMMGWVFALTCWRVASRVISNRRMLADLDAQSIRGPSEPHWLTGHMIDVFVTNGPKRYDYVTERMAALSTRCMRLDSFIISNKSTELVITDPKAVAHVLKNNADNYIKNTVGGEELFYNFKAFLGDGIFAVSHGPHAPDKGKSWYMQRKITSQMFTMNEFKNFIFSSFGEKADVLVEQLGQRAASGGAVDMQDYFFKYTMDAFGQIAFDAKFNTLEGQSNEYGDAFDGAHAAFLGFYQERMLIAVIAELFPSSSWIRQAMEWGMRLVIPELKEFNGHMKTLQRYTKQVIEDRRSCSKEQIGCSKDILGLFLKASAEQEQPFSEKYLTDVVLNLIIAGRDTTACMLSWTFYELARNPEVLAKLREELRGADSDDYESMKHQPYLTAVFYEVERLWPSVPMDGKIAAQDDTFPDGTRIRAGASVSYAPYIMGRDPELYPNPEQFRPERWLLDGKFKAPSQFEYPVFQAGPRLCLGMNFALMEATVATTKLLQSFDFELASPDDESLIPDTGKLTMSIKGPLNMHLTPRQ